MNKIKVIVLFVMLCVSLAAQEYPTRPDNYITDRAGILTKAEINDLNAKLKEFEDSTSNQIFVFITQSLGNRVMSELCQEIFHIWRIGDQEKNNGILIGIFIDDRKFRIHTGYGLEGALPDILTKKIQDEDMKPYFKNNEYYIGINNGVNKLMEYSGEEYQSEVSAGNSEEHNQVVSWLIGFAPNIILAFIVFYNLFSKRSAQNRTTRSKVFLAVLALVFSFIPCIGTIPLFIILGVVSVSKLKGGKRWGSKSPDSSWASSNQDSSFWSSSGSDSDFSGGGGGDSGGGGSDSSW
jgi:uncharacterized protein